MLRSDWLELPRGIRDAVAEVVGPVLESTMVSTGLNSALAVTLHLVDGSKVFAKGLRTDQNGVVAQDREALIAPYLGEVAPRFRAQVVAQGWNVLLFEHVDGVHVDYAPGSPDIRRVVEAIDLLGKIAVPADVRLKHAEQRWSSYVDADECELLRGNTLLHTDFNPHNVLLTDTGTYLVDWAWPTRGAAWIDLACLVVRLIEAGNSPSEAEDWVSRAVAWREADPAAVDVFARANARMWDEIAGHNPTAWTTMAVAARAWLGHRESRAGYRANAVEPR